MGGLLRLDYDDVERVMKWNRIPENLDHMAALHHFAQTYAKARNAQRDR